MEQKKNPQPTFCVSAKIRFTQIYISGFLVLDPDCTSLGAIRNFSTGTELLRLGIRSWGTKGLSKGLGASGSKGLEPNYYLHLSPLFMGIPFILGLFHSSPVFQERNSGVKQELGVITHAKIF